MVETIEYKSPIGKLLLTCNENAVESLLFINDDLANSAFLNEESSPKQTFKFPVTNQAVKELNNYFDGSSFHFSVKLQQQGTDFQQSVWDVLTTIKPGTTKSYLQLSKYLGNAKAIRAVGTANGRNAIPIIVPCHRVIGSNGSLVGYGGGLWRKKWLLEHEAKHLSGMQLLF